MRNLDLREYKKSENVKLSAEEFRALRARLNDLDLRIEPAGDGAWDITPGSTVGALEIEDVLSVSIQPKLDIGRVFFLASYALGEFRLRDLESFLYPEKDPPLETMARFFADAAQRAFARGLLHGYRSEEEALLTVRGRVRFDEQIRRRFGVPLPVEVRYDDFTEDVLSNRLVKAAALALGAMRLKDPKSRTQLGRVTATLEIVTPVSFAPPNIPTVTFDRLNEHYRHVIGLSRLILQHATVETGRGPVRAAGFLMDMNKVFESFVRRALREELGLPDHAFPDSNTAHLDRAQQIRLRPDLTWREAGRCVFVGDAKYKRVRDTQVPNADLYQLLAYATAFDLPGGILVYAKGEKDPAEYRVRNTAKTLEVFALDLAGEPTDLRVQIKQLAKGVRSMASQAPVVRAA